MTGSGRQTVAQARPTRRQRPAPPGSSGPPSQAAIACPARLQRIPRLTRLDRLHLAPNVGLALQQVPLVHFLRRCGVLVGRHDAGGVGLQWEAQAGAYGWRGAGRCLGPAMPVDCVCEPGNQPGERAEQPHAAHASPASPTASAWGPAAVQCIAGCMCRRAAGTSSRLHCPPNAPLRPCTRRPRPVPCRPQQECFLPLRPHMSHRTSPPPCPPTCSMSSISHSAPIPAGELSAPLGPHLAPHRISPLPCHPTCTIQRTTPHHTTPHHTTPHPLLLARSRTCTMSSISYSVPAPAGELSDPWDPT